MLKTTGGYSQQLFGKMAYTLKAYNDCQILCMAHPYTISNMMPNTYSDYYFSSNDNINKYKKILYGVEIKPCDIMQINKIFMFPYIFENGFPYVKGVSGIMELFD